MSTRYSLSITSTLLALLCASILLVATLSVRVASAQSATTASADTTTTNADLHAAIVALLLADPRAAGLPQKEFDGMVNALVAAAQKKGLTVQEISWRPQPVSNLSQNAAVEEVEACSKTSILCMIDEAFGFTGPDMTIPVWIGICSAILVLIIGGMWEIHHRKHLAPSVPKNLQK